MEVEGEGREWREGLVQVYLVSVLTLLYTWSRGHQSARKVVGPGGFENANSEIQKLRNSEISIT
jgi:hypothetical protein